MAGSKLSEQEKQEIIRLIEADRPLPDKYRFLLFDDKREVELVWNGKTRDVCSTVLPFQVIEQIDEPRAERPKGEHTGFLFDDRGRQSHGWTNKLIWGDNKLILASLKAGPLRKQIEDAGGLKLIYIDPPFDVGADFSMDIEIGGETLTKEPNILEQIAYRDTWGRGADSFIAMIYERLILMRDLLHPEGCIYVHCDWRVNSFIRMVMDEVFGKNNLINELVWKRRTGYMGTFNRYGAVTDTLFWYSKSDNYVFNEQTIANNPEYLERFKHLDEKGRRYRLDNLTSPNPRPNLKYEYKGFQPPDNGWAVSREKMAQMEAEGRLEFPKKPGGRIQRRRFIDELEGQPVQNLWDDIYPVNPMAVEGLGYPTQKPESLIERILKTSTEQGDLVADFFCGSGTTAAVAEKLERKWIATDLGKFAIHTTRKRMIGVQRQIKAEGKPFRPFEVLNLGKYERQHFIAVNENLRDEERARQISRKEEEFVALILRAYKAEAVGGFPVFHGKKAGRMVTIGPVNLPVTRLFVEEIILECRKKKISKVDLLGFEFEMGLFPNALDEARGKGIDIAPKHIPAEVFDKRAVERGQVVFHDVSAIEARPHFRNEGRTKELAVELTDFHVYYSQDTLANAESTLSNGKHKLIVERGQVMKVIKDKHGVITREQLTRTWTDWIDYWAVDFLFESKREIVNEQDPETGEWQERWTGEYVFENEWQSFRTKRDRTLELKTPFRECQPGPRKVAVKVIDIFGNDTMTILNVNV